MIFIDLRRNSAPGLPYLGAAIHYFSRVNMYVRLLLVFVITSLTVPALAQMPAAGQLTGLVIDVDTRAPLGDASVALFDNDNAFVTGTATTSDGRFVIDRVPQGSYTMRVSFIGYATRAIEEIAIRAGQPTDLGTIELATDDSVLGEVEVAGERELVEQRVDRTVYNVAAQSVTTGGNVLETLQTLPSIEVDTEGNVALRGNQNVAVHINGRPVPMRGQMLSAMLRQIPATNVERVEVLPNPSARHEPDGMSGIINIVLKEGTNRGLSGGLTLGGGTQPNAELSGNVAYQQGPFDTYVSYGFRHDNWGMDGTSTRTSYLTSGTSVFDQTMAIGNQNNSHFLNGTFDYTPVQGTTIGFSGSLGLRRGEEDFQVGYVFDPDAATSRQSERLTVGRSDGLNGDAALNFRRQFDGDAHKISTEARYSRNASERIQNYLDRNLMEASPADLSRSTVDDGTTNLSYQLDYNRPVENVRLETGVKLTRRLLDNDRLVVDLDGGSPTVIPGRTSDFRYEEDVYAAYTQATRAFGKFEIQGGLRGEAVSRDIMISASNTSFAQTYSSLYPSAFLMYNVEPGTSAKFSFSRRVNRPNTFFLNPTPQYEDTIMVDRGNPELRPEYTNSFEVALQYKYFVTVTPFYRHTTDVIRRRMLFNPETGVSTGTFQNLDSQSTYGTDVTLMAQFGGMRGFLSGSAYRSVTDGGSIETGLASDGFVWTLRGNLQARLREGTNLQVFAFYRAPLNVEDGRISAFGVATLGLSQQFLGDRMRLNVRVNDVLKTARFEFDTGNDNYHFIGVRQPHMQQVSASLTYTFGQQRPQRRPQQSTEQQPDMNIGF
jgi:outer membrane receptor protein involved in Fe transport